VPAWVVADGAGVRLLERRADRWVIQVEGAQPGATLTARQAYYPLWRATSDGRSLAIRADTDALQRVALPAGEAYTVVLEYRRGWPEWAGLLLAIASLAATVILLL
jgi:hypothetical protein